MCDEEKENNVKKLVAKLILLRKTGGSSWHVEFVMHEPKEAQLAPLPLVREPDI